MLRNVKLSPGSEEVALILEVQVHCTLQDVEDGEVWVSVDHCSGTLEDGMQREEVTLIHCSRGPEFRRGFQKSWHNALGSRGLNRASLLYCLPTVQFQQFLRRFPC